MNADAPTGRPRTRWRLIVRITLAVALWFFAIAMTDEVVKTILSFARVWIPEWIRVPLYLGGTAAAIGAFLQKRPRRIGSLAIPDGFWSKLERASDRLLGGALAALLGTAAASMLLSWFPAYLAWPWWVDTGHFALSAQSWDAGILPYRDLIDINFPGPIYVMWVLGKTFGWGRSVPVYLLDGLMVGLLGAALCLWSRARFRRLLPGVTAYVVFLPYYLSLDYSRVAQRDWHAVLFVVLSLLILQSRPGRKGLVMSALMFAASLAVRPYGVLFLPALLSAIDENVRPRGEPIGRTARALAEWMAWTAFFVILAFVPLIASGILDDFVNNLLHAVPGGDYAERSRGQFWRRLVDELRSGLFLTTLAASAFALVLGPTSLRRSVRTWLLALVGVAFYRPLSPMDHDYLVHARNLVNATALAPLVAAWLETTWPTSPVRLFGMLFLLFIGDVRIPVHCSPRRSLETIACLARGVPPEDPPTGCARNFRKRSLPRVISWGEYLATLDYLSKSTRPETRVANAICRHPFPAINGPAGRLTPFPSASGVLWLRAVSSDLEPRYIASLTAAGADSVVVWLPDFAEDELNFRCPRLVETIREYYRPEAQFGMIGIWRRRPCSP